MIPIVLRLFSLIFIAARLAEAPCGLIVQLCNSLLHNCQFSQDGARVAMEAVMILSDRLPASQ